MAIRKINLMHKLFGLADGYTCRECSNLEKVLVHDRHLTKCRVYGNTSSAASDWAQRYQACGMFDKPWNGKPIIRTVAPVRTKQEEAQRIPLAGQISMEEIEKNVGRS